MFAYLGLMPVKHSVLNVKGPSRGLLRDYKPSDGPSFQALVLGWAGVSAEMTGAGVLQEPPTMTLDAPRWERNFYVIMCSNSAHCHSAYL